MLEILEILGLETVPLKFKYLPEFVYCLIIAISPSSDDIVPFCSDTVQLHHNCFMWLFFRQLFDHKYFFMYYNSHITLTFLTCLCKSDSGFIPIFVYAVFGSSRQLAIGPVALVSLLVSNVLGSIVDSSDELYTELAILLALMVGILECIMGLLRYFCLFVLLSFFFFLKILFLFLFFFRLFHSKSYIMQNEFWTNSFTFALTPISDFLGNKCLMCLYVHIFSYFPCSIFF